MEDGPRPVTRIDALTGAIIGAAIEVHSTLGRGFVESIYEAALAMELRARGIPFERQYVIPIYYRDSLIGEHRLDLLVGDEVVVELKVASAISDAHVAQTLSYLKAGSFRLGLILNFNVAVLKNGIRRIAAPL